LVEKLYLGMLAEDGFRDGQRIVEILRKPKERLDIRGSDARLIAAVARILKPRLRAAEREFFRDHLLWGGPMDETDGRQKQLAHLLESTLGNRGFQWSQHALADLANSARSRGEAWTSLAFYLDRIRTCESVAAPVSALFAHILALDDRPVKDAVARLREMWGSGLGTISVEAYRGLRTELSSDSSDPTEADRWIAIAEAAASGAYAELLDLLFKQNRHVMKGRGGTPWVEEANGRLKVRFRDEQGVLPGREEIPLLWRFSYFLDSLRIVASTVAET